MRERRFDAAERIRTSTPVKARRPERRVYTSFTTAARAFNLATFGRWQMPDPQAAPAGRSSWRAGAARHGPRLPGRRR
jgi:hypothetical protein